MPELVTMDGNEAAGRVAHRLSEVIAIYPITPASPMGELADTLSSRGTTNLWGDVPLVIEMQSEGGAAGALHGALQGGALATTFTASQGLLLMLPNMYKVAGELTPAVMHVASRSIATHALSIFGDHGDVMSTRGTGWAIMHATSVQEAHDMALVAHAATLRSRVPFMHVIDGFRTSHELSGVETLGDDVLAALVPSELVGAHRGRALAAADPVLRGTAQNPDVFFQSREATNRYYDAVPDIVTETMESLRDLTDRPYGIVEYTGHPEATDVVILSGSGVWAARRAAEQLNESGRRCGVVNLRLFRPFPIDALVGAIAPTVESIAVLDRCKEPGSAGEPMLLDVTAALTAAARDGRLAAPLPAIVGGRYGLGSKEFTPAMAASVFDAIRGGERHERFTIGITDDVTDLSLPMEPDRFAQRAGVRRAVLVGLGSDGTVGAAKSACRIVGEQHGEHAQGYFVYDSKKSGAVTVSHLRFSRERLEAPWLVRKAQYVGIHQFSLLDRLDLIDLAAPGATVVINSPHGATGTWDRLPLEVQEQIRDRDLHVHIIDAARVSRDVGLGGIVSTVMFTCFVELANLLPPGSDAGAGLEAVKAEIRREYGKLGDAVLRPNFAAVDAALGQLEPLVMPADGSQPGTPRAPLVPGDAPDFVQRVTASLMAGLGDRLPVSAFPPDGTYPVGTARFEKRGIAHTVPSWEPELCIDCGKCAVICPHAAVRTKAYTADALTDAPATFLHKDAKHLDARQLTVQVFPDDCTGCGLCVEICPARSVSS